MKICCISDTHLKHKEVEADIPECDLLIHAGDFTSSGSIDEFLEFAKWIIELPQAKDIVLIAGNHDFICERKPDIPKNIFSNTKVKYLNQSWIRYNSLKIYGTPYTPFFYNWAFNGVDILQKASIKVTELHPYLGLIYSYIPSDTDILVCHGPPRGILDMTKEGYSVGSESMSLTLENNLLDLKLYICGHIHESYGIRNDKKKDRNLRYVNASSLNRNYKYINKPIILDI